jgi:ribonucleotide reductase beta subunit family protein with ferritin-like domain
VSQAIESLTRKLEAISSNHRNSTKKKKKENVVHLHKAYYSAKTNEDYMSFAGKWMELEIVMLSDINQFHEDKYCIFSVICAL